MALQRKKKIVARVRCENIKTGCPKPACETPVLLPERCCKVCPGEDGAGLEEDLVVRKLDSDDEDKNVKEFSVLLTGRGLSTPAVSSTGAARAYLTFNKRSLHYTVHSAELERATVVRFMDEDENILEEHEVPSPHHHVISSKVCGVWKKIPKVYRRLLLKEKLVMALASERQPDGIVAGKILKNMRITKEVYSSLLIPGNPKAKLSSGGGGVAMISTERNSVYVILDFNGIFLPSDSRSVPVYLEVLKEDAVEGKLVTVTSAVSIMPKVHPEFNTVNVKVDLSQEAQQQMALGQLRLRISARDQSLYLHGPVTPKITCNVFQTTMAGGPGAAVAQVAIQPPYGTLSYQMQVSNEKDLEQSFSVSLEIEDASSKDTRTLVSSNNSQVIENTIRGTFPVTMELIEMLFSDEISLAIAMGQSNNKLKMTGRIRQRLYIDAFVNEVPLMLLPPPGPVNLSSVAQAWLIVDKDCDLHYALYASGLTSVATAEDKEEKERHVLEIQEVPKDAPPQQKLLQRLNPYEVEGIQEDMSLFTFSRMKAGQANLVVSSKAPGRAKILELKTRIVHVPVPITCLPRQGSSQESGVNFMDDESNVIQGTDPSRRCYYEEQLYEDGAQWKAHHDHCTMCSCQRGRVVCDKILCAPTTCENAITPPDQCCAICVVGEPVVNTSATDVKNQRGCYFEGDKTYHLAGSSWHPYIPPFGFSRCALCTCQTESLVVECKRITCPPLPCAEKEAFREHPQSCCKQCPSEESNVVRVKSAVILPDQLGDQGCQKSPKDILAAGGCNVSGQLYANGDSWHPTVQPYGKLKCINCHCKDSRPKCKRQKCPKLTCAVKLTSEKDCCPKCAENSPKRKAPSSGGNPDRRHDKTRKNRERRVQDGTED